MRMRRKISSCPYSLLVRLALTPKKNLAAYKPSILITHIYVSKIHEDERIQCKEARMTVRSSISCFADFEISPGDLCKVSI